MKDKRGRPITVGCPVAVAFCDGPGWHGESCEPYLITGNVIEVRENSCKIQLDEEHLWSSIYVCGDSDRIVRIK